jgi:hypothetical protein
MERPRKYPARRLGYGALVSLAAVQGCGGSTTTGSSCAAAEAQFSRASISVDGSKRMSDLTADERAAACSEFSRALTASFGAVEISCRLGSHSGTREGQATCQPWYDACLQTMAARTR